LLTFFALSAVLFAACEQATGGDGGGGNTPEITIRRRRRPRENRRRSRLSPDRAYTLGVNLTLQNLKPIGAYTDPFTGTFNGNSKTITGTGEDGADCAALGWDFNAIWTMGADGYPALRWENE
jgi:hypothetical protein